LDRNGLSCHKMTRIGLVGEVLIFIFSGGGSCGLELRLADFESYDHQGNFAIAEAGSLAMF